MIYSCVGYHKLNDVTQKDAYCILCNDDIYNKINQSINQSTFGLYTSLVVRKDREKLPLVLT